MNALFIDQDSSGTLESGTTLTKVEHHFMRKFASRMPAQVAKSYTASKVHAIIHTNGEHSWESHAIDVRVTLPMLARSYYFVIPARIYKRSRSRNHAERFSHPLEKLSDRAFVLFIRLLLGCFGLNFLDVFKSALRLNVTRGFSVGVWDSIASGVSSQ